MNEENQEFSAQKQAQVTLWQQAVSFVELCELTARFIEGDITYHPGYFADRLDQESQPYLYHLAAFNRAGLLTECSQPGTDEGHSRQRAFIVGFALEPLAYWIERLSVTTDLYVSVCPPGRIYGCRIPVTLDVFRAYTWAGDTSINEQIDMFVELEPFERICHPLALQDLQQAHHVSIIDLCWGRKNYLWNELAKSLCFSLEPHEHIQALLDYRPPQET